MRKLLLLTLWVWLLIGCGAQKPPRFERYFHDRTLRIDYYREGCRQHDTVLLAAFKEKRCGWAGSTTQLLDPFDNGAYRVVVRDARSGKELYSRCYNSLFREYCDTPEGADSVVRYQEVLNIPMPKRPMEICMQERDSNMQFFTVSVFHFKPGDAQASAHSGAAVRKLQFRGDSHQKMDVAIVPEGYGGPMAAEKMLHDFDKFVEYLFAQEPFKGHRDDFNVWGAMLPPAPQNGVTDPLAGQYIDSPVGAQYNTFGADRYLMTFNLFGLHDLLDSVPCDHIIIMVNSNKYGGGAIYNFYAISSLDRMAGMILPHELGHSIGGLADEYVDENLSYGDMHQPTQEPKEPNITSLVDFASKWAAMLPAGTPVPTPRNDSVPRTENGPLGCYEGAGYHPKGLYRPVMHCMMRDYAPFCPVCTRRLEEVFALYCR